MLIPYPLEPPPPLPPLDDPWEAAGADLDSGRRGRRFPERVVFYDGPGIAQLELLGPLEVRDRRIMALEEPLFVWDVTARGPLTMLAELTFPGERIRYSRSADGASLWLRCEAGTDELLVGCQGGLVGVDEAEGILRLQARGRDRLRLVIVAAWSEEDRDRTLRTLARKRIAGVVAQQVRHNEMIARLGVRVTTPDPDVDAQHEFDKLEFESGLHERRSGLRILADEPYDTGYLLLSFGLREPVRDTLRAPLDDPERRRLFAAYAQWAGADEFVRRHWRRCLEAVDAAERRYRTGPPEPGQGTHELAAFELAEVAEALGDHAAFERLAEVAEAVAGTHPTAFRQELTPALDHWGIVPMALEGAVALDPALPEAWPEMTLERLRVGDSSLDIRVRRRPAGVAVKVRLTRGPPIVVHLAPRLDFIPTGVLMEGAQLEGPSVRFTAEGEVEGVWTR